MSAATSFKVMGKKVALPAGGDWKFSPRPGGWWIAENAGTGERVRFCIEQNRGKIGASIGGRLWQGELIEAPRGGAHATGGSDSDLVAQFPGKVRKLLVAEGAAVKEGDPLLLVEAMKMEFKIKAPFDGRVDRVLVKEGQQLGPGDRFVEMSAAQGTE